MKKLLSFVGIILFFIPFVVSAANTRYIYSNASDYLSVSVSSANVPMKVYWENNSAGDLYAQLQLTYDNYTDLRCVDTQIVTPGNSYTWNFALDGSEQYLSSIDIVSSLTNATTTGNCLNDSVMYDGLLYQDYEPDAITIGQMSVGGGSRCDLSSTTTVEVINNPSLDFFLGIVLFWIPVFFFIWVWKGRK